MHISAYIDLSIYLSIYIYVYIDLFVFLSICLSINYIDLSIYIFLLAKEEPLEEGRRCGARAPLFGGVASSLSLLLLHYSQA